MSGYIYVFSGYVLGIVSGFCLAIMWLAWRNR